MEEAEVISAITKEQGKQKTVKNRENKKEKETEERKERETDLRELNKEART